MAKNKKTKTEKRKSNRLRIFGAERIVITVVYGVLVGVMLLAHAHPVHVINTVFLWLSMMFASYAFSLAHYYEVRAFAAEVTLEITQDLAEDMVKAADKLLAEAKVLSDKKRSKATKGNG